MDVALQWVRTSWSKRSRGGPMAARRNAAPVAFALPTITLPVRHEVLADEAQDFEPCAQVHHNLPARSDLLLRERDGALQVQLVPSAWGMPQRRPLPPVRVAAGEWLRWQINYRFGGDRDWSYRLDTVSIAYGPVTADVFLGAPPRLVDQRGRLL